MNIEDILRNGIVFKGMKEKPVEEEPKIRTKAKKTSYVKGQHKSGSAKMKAEIRRKRANRSKKK
ncbi:MAG: hypothetical protein LUD02_11510 [Tannerellaceae bacterium]|nr:hypothetical protein [Tannerellaceae bacterium]MCD8264684.1 hypothetical protein [Tannerellaceae bacterium]